MGILYNRFNPDLAIQSLIPYSLQSNIVTYLVPSSFNGSSSTSWGDDYPKPMQRDTSTRPSTWSYNSDDSVHLACPGYPITGFTIPMNADSIRTFTVYMVVRYNADDTIRSKPNFVLASGLSNNIYIYWGDENKVRVRYGQTFLSYLIPAGSAFGNYHVYAFRQQTDNYCHVVDDGNLVSISSTQISHAPLTYNFAFESYPTSTTTDTTIDVKFLSIVKGSESDATILNNVQNIMVALNIH